MLDISHIRVSAQNKHGKRLNEWKIGWTDGWVDGWMKLGGFKNQQQANRYQEYLCPLCPKQPRGVLSPNSEQRHSDSCASPGRAGGTRVRGVSQDSLTASCSLLSSEQKQERACCFLAFPLSASSSSLNSAVSQVVLGSKLRPCVL
jgi:hypothetical protein